MVMTDLFIRFYFFTVSTYRQTDKGCLPMFLIYHLFFPFATKKEVKEILAAIVQSFRDRNLDFYEGGTETAENVRENWQPLEFWTPLENWPPFVNQDSLYAYANFYTSCINITAVSLENIPEIK